VSRTWNGLGSCNLYNTARSDAAKLVFTIMKAVEYIHDGDIVHRKLRPEDMFFRTPAEGADVMIADFSLSRVIKEGKYHLTDICGTLGYMTPEIFKLSM
jgi:calcium/calmodulin-dependent protein kinase I